ncbi:MAG: glycosyltransferase family 39 protein [Candidatus Krumholzibacteria bacterium]|nr:glycosyltransferase family 39 protein [Candidatus Krumholzibacteria bacterium]MDH4336579.1 glycosyltransferase family 39 protein [Candidatus Krumholzibacteria bacterium]MDH5271016.1 glycosyltransferase family 39 protein [Candidatus Krumholzibacteria bacterium]
MNRERISPVATGGGWRDVAIVTVVALLVRLACFFINSRGNPAFDYLIMDSMYIDRWARALVAGDPGPAVYFRGPLYPAVLGLIYKISGGSHAAAVIFNHICGAVTCGLIVVLARQYFTRAVALVAGLVAAFYWPLIYFEGEILVEPLFIALLVLSLWRLARAVSAPTLVRIVVAGACLGLSALARPTALVLVAVVPVAFHASGLRARAWLRPTLLFAVAVIAVLVPSTVHNYRGSHALVPVAWSGGLNFYIGNNAESDGRSAFIPGAVSPWMGGGDEALAIARDQSGRELTPAQASSYFFGRGVDYLASEPLDAMELLASKLYTFWEGPERSNEKYIYFFWKRYGLGRVPMPGFWLVAPLAFVGMVGLWPRRRELALPYGFVVAYMLGVVAFFVVARLRLPVVPVVIVFASWAALELVRVAREGAWKRLGIGAAVFAAAFVFCNAGYPRFAAQRPNHDIVSHYTLAGAMMEGEDTDGALLELARARIAFERAPTQQYVGIAQDVYFKLGTLLYERGRCKEAADALGRVLPGDPRAAAARVMFADCCEKTGRFADAAKAYQLILRRAPQDEAALAGLVRCLEATGDYAEAARVRARLGALQN